MSEATKPEACGCGAAPKLIFACSGAADVGEIADRAARELTSAGVGRMFCLAGVGGRVSGIMETTKAAAAVLAIDGCPLDCVKRTLEQAGFTRFEHLQLSDLGMAKGKTPPSETTIAQVVNEGKRRMASGANPCESGR